MPRNPLVDSIVVTEFTEASLHDFHEQLNFLTVHEPETIKIFIDSFGGCADMLWGMISRLEMVKAAGHKIETIVLSHAESAGAILFLAGDRRFMGEDARLMFHAPSFENGLGWWDTFVNFITGRDRNYLNHLDLTADHINDRIKKWMGAQLNKDSDWVELALMSEEVLFTKEEATECGIATRN